jgi:DNA-binding FadR family transcriptional regulator
MKNFHDLLSCRTRGLQLLYAEPVTLATIIRQHGNILKAVRGRDQDAACTAMREHIAFIIDFVHEKKIS